MEIVVHRKKVSNLMNCSQIRQVGCRNVHGRIGAARARETLHQQGSLQRKRVQTAQDAWQIPHQIYLRNSAVRF